MGEVGEHAPAGRLGGADRLGELVHGRHQRGELAPGPRVGEADVVAAARDAAGGGGEVVEGAAEASGGEEAHGQRGQDAEREPGGQRDPRRGREERLLGVLRRRAGVVVSAIIMCSWNTPGPTSSDTAIMLAVIAATTAA